MTTRRSHAGAVDAECSSCPYWHHVQAEDGVCRQHGPHPLHGWPVTAEYHWCGDHPAMKDAPAATWDEDEDRWGWTGTGDAAGS